MAAVERDKPGERPDPITQTRKVVDLVLQVPHHARDTGRVLDAVGCILADLHVLERHQGLMRQLGSGITTDDVDIAREQILQAAAIRPVDDAATEQRLIVLAGLQRIRQASEFNENVAKRAENGMDGITVFQVGISSDTVKRAIVHVNEAKQLVEGAPRSIQEPEPEAEASLPDTEADQPVITIEEPVVEPDIPIFTPPSDFVSRQAGENASSEPPKAQAPIARPQRVSRKIRGLSRRSLLKWTGGALGTLATAGQITKVAPILDWTGDFFDWHPVTPEQEEAFIKIWSLNERLPTRLGSWNVAYPALQESEEFVDIFKNFNEFSTEYSIPIYAPVGENNPFPLLVTQANFGVEVYKSKVSPTPLAAVKYGTNNGWGLISGRKIPESPEQRPYPNVIQVENAATKSTFYLEVKPLQVGDNYRMEIRYMKKVKRS